MSGIRAKGAVSEIVPPTEKKVTIEDLIVTVREINKMAKLILKEVRKNDDDPRFR